MTLKEAVLKSLEELSDITNYMKIYNHIMENKYYDFSSSKTPSSTVSAVLGDFIRNGDSRVKRIKQDGGSYSYYLTKNEPDLNLEIFNDSIDLDPKSSKIKSFYERDLHKLLSSFLKNSKTYSKTIFHEQSNGKDNNQAWTHPDMVGIQFLKLRSNVSQNFIKAINQVETFKLSSYEIKKEINSDTELKKAYFQAVSNSSWANHGYLVAFEFSDNLNEEMERLNQAFGIGIIELNSNPFQSRILYPSVYRNLDFRTIDKLSNINKEFERFIEQIEKLLTAEERYHKVTEKELNEFSDSYLTNETEIEKYCKEKNIPMDILNLS